MQVEYRRERDADAEAVDRLLAACFPTRAEADLVQRLRAAGSLIAGSCAVVEGQTAGYAACSLLTLDGRPLNAVGLAPVATAEVFRRQGIGRRVVEFALDQCRALGFELAAALGEPAYYQRFGFAPASRWNLRCVYTDSDAFMALELSPAAVSRLCPSGGLLRYAPEFDVFEE